MSGGQAEMVAALRAQVAALRVALENAAREIHAMGKGPRHVHWSEMPERYRFEECPDRSCVEARAALWEGR